MKVKVTYTVGYEDVPTIVNELLDKCRTQLKRSSEFKFDFFNLDETTVRVVQLQKELDLVAAQLEDCVNLCTGYNSAKNSLPQLPETDDMEQLTAELTELTEHE